MTKKNYATPFAILIAGTLISAAIYFRPVQLPNAEHDSHGPVESDIADYERERAEALLWGMVPIELEGWDPPATEDDLRRINDAWEKHWPLKMPDHKHDRVI